MDSVERWGVSVSLFITIRNRTSGSKRFSNLGILARNLPNPLRVSRWVDDWNVVWNCGGVSLLELSSTWDVLRSVSLLFLSDSAFCGGPDVYCLVWNRLRLKVRDGRRRSILSFCKTGPGWGRQLPSPVLHFLRRDGVLPNADHSLRNHPWYPSMDRLGLRIGFWACISWRPNRRVCEL